MIAGIVVGNVWATRKNEKLSGFKLLIVQPINYYDLNDKSAPIIAVDIIGAGIGEKVIVSRGASARYAVLDDGDAPIDSAVVGIIDGEDIDDRVFSK